MGDDAHGAVGEDVPAPPTPESDKAEAPGDEAEAPGDVAEAPGDVAEAPEDKVGTPGDEVETPGDEVAPPGEVEPSETPPKVADGGALLWAVLAGLALAFLLWGLSAGEDPSPEADEAALEGALP